MEYRYKEWRGHPYALNRGRPEKVEPLPSYKNAPRHKRVHSHIKMVKGAFLLAIPLAIKSNYSK